MIKPAVGFRIAYEGYGVVMSGDTRLTEEVAARDGTAAKDFDVSGREPARQRPRRQSNFVLFQPHLRNMAGGVLRGTIGYGSPTIARVWIDK